MIFQPVLVTCTSFAARDLSAKLKILGVHQSKRKKTVTEIDAAWYIDIVAMHVIYRIPICYSNSENQEDS